MKEKAENVARLQEELVKLETSARSVNQQLINLENQLKDEISKRNNVQEEADRYKSKILYNPA